MTGLFGGSFNPPHVGHLAVAEACGDAAGLDRVVWMPAAVSPHKVGDRDAVPAALRLEMVRAAVAGNGRFEVSDLETRRAGVSYTVDTVRGLAGELGPLAGADPGRVALIIGGDSLATFPTWREPQAIVELARLVVYRRPGDGVRVDALPDWLADAVTIVDGPPLDLSSSAVRARVAAGQTVRYLVPDDVREIVRREGLYGAPATPGRIGAGGER